MNKKGNSSVWTFKYALLNIAYFAAFCTVHAYAAVYLLAHGFSNTQVGVLLAIANVVSALCQPLAAAVIDRQGWLTNKRFILISVLVILAGSIILMGVNDNRVIIFIVYALIYMVQFTYQPVLTALCFEYQKRGCGIIFGLARGLGSAGFAVTSAIIGGIVEKDGVFVLLIANVILMVISAVVIILWDRGKTGAIDVPVKDIQAKGQDSASLSDTPEGSASPHNKLSDFIREYPAFIYILVGTMLFFFAHNMINDFMIQIIRSLGGAEKELGYCNFLQAILELPVMALIGFALKKIRPGALLILSGTGFFLKILILVFAVNMSSMYLSQSFQLIAYAVFVPAAAYYVNENMEALDQVKGQAFITSAITIGGVFSNIVSGRILDKMGVKPMLIVGTTVCAIGVIVALTGIMRKPARLNK